MGNIKRPEGGYGAEDYRAMARKGLSQAEAARELRVSREAVRQMAVKYDIEFADGRASPNEEKYLALHKAGLGNKEIAERCGVSPSAVSLFFSAREMRRNKVTRSGYKDALLQLAKSGASKSEAAKSLGIAQSHVSRLAKVLGITFVDGRAKRFAKRG